MWSIAEQRISAQSAGAGDEKVRITVIPETIDSEIEDQDRLDAEEAIENAGEQLPGGDEPR